MVAENLRNRNFPFQSKMLMISFRALNMVILMIDVVLEILAILEAQIFIYISFLKKYILNGILINHGIHE